MSSPMPRVKMPKHSSQPFPHQTKFPDKHHQPSLHTRTAAFHDAIYRSGHNMYPTADAKMDRTFSYKNRIQMTARKLYESTWG